MKTIETNKPVMVTGATGYMASWIVRKLLEQGIDVNATVRDASNAQKVEHLEAMAKNSTGKLRLFEADLLKPGSFDEPMKGCELVIHTASPFFMTKPRNPQEELIGPAKEGTRNVLEAAKRTPTVKRVVLTSSIAAICGDLVDVKRIPEKAFAEHVWNTTSSAQHLPYYYSKTVAEKEAWAIAKSQDRWDLVTLNPGVILGPSVSKRTDSYSINTMIQLGDGTYKSGVPKAYFPFVDVRDVASAHIKAGFMPEASGRHIIAGGEASFLDLATILRKHFGDTYPFPRKEVPKFLVWLIAPKVGLTRRFVSRNVGCRAKFDNSYSKADLKMSYIPIEQTVREHFQQILDDGLLQKPGKVR